MRTTTLLGVLSACVLIACGGGAAEQAGSAAPAAPAGGDQIATGQSLYADNCASCHGAGGEGKGNTPAVVGKGALPLDPRPGSKRGVQFKTVADVDGWVKANMPPKGAGTLSDDQYWAILAFDLKANGVDLSGKHLDGALAQTLVIPR
jgi:mono/diheme cytochrome c family protein